MASSTASVDAIHRDRLSAEIEGMTLEEELERLSSQELADPSSSASATDPTNRSSEPRFPRIPVELSLDAETVTIERQGDALILRPLPSGGWDQFFADPTLVLPPELELEEDDPPPGTSCLLIEP